MSITCKFLSQEFSFHNDLLVYLDALSIADEIQEALFDLFVKKVKASSVKVIDNKELEDEMRNQASRYIQKLCDHNIYDKTIDEYVFENEGHKVFCDVNAKALKAMSSFLMEEMQNFQKGLETAEANAASNITGTGVSVWTSSFLTLAATSAYEYSVLKKQANKADRQYQAEINATIQAGSDKKKQQEVNYLNTVYFPEMSKALMLFAYRMLDRYLSDLNEAGLFNNEALEYINIKRSQDLLQNLKIVSDKSKVLTSAFQCCPFNVEIFYKAEQLGLIGDDEIETLKSLKQFDVFFDEMKHRFVSLKHTDNINSDLDSMDSLLRILCLCSGKNKEFYYKQYTKAIYQNIVSEYKTIRNYSENTEACSEILDSLGDDILTTSEDDLHGIAEKKVLKIVSTQSFEVLISRCGYSNLLQEISPKNDIGSTFASKEELDTHYITTLFNNLSALLSEKQKKTKIRIDNQAEKERAINSKRSQRKIFVIIALCVLLILPIMIQFILVNAWVNDITDYVEKMISVNIEKESRQEDSFFNEAGLQSNFKITGIKFYKQDYGPFYIAPEVTYYSNQNDLPSITASLGTFDLCSSIGEDDVTIPFYISSSDSYTTIMANDTVIQKDGTKINIDHFDDFFEGYSKDNSKQVNPYLPSGFIVFYLIYGTILVIVFLVLKKKEYGLPHKTQ